MLEDKIIKQCIAGNSKAQEKLYNFYARRMKGICIRYAKSVFEAEDIFQDAFIKVFTYLVNYKMEGSFDGWIRRIVVNTAIDHYKKNQSLEKHFEQYDGADEIETESFTVEQKLYADDLLKILSLLPDGYRLVFNLYAIEGYNHKEIADLLNISEGTSKSQLSKARRYIQHLLPQINN